MDETEFGKHSKKNDVGKYVDRVVCLDGASESASCDGSFGRELQRHVPT